MHLRCNRHCQGGEEDKEVEQPHDLQRLACQDQLESERSRVRECEGKGDSCEEERACHGRVGQQRVASEGGDWLGRQHVVIYIDVTGNLRS